MSGICVSKSNWNTTNMVIKSQIKCNTKYRKIETIEHVNSIWKKIQQNQGNTFHYAYTW